MEEEERQLRGDGFALKERKKKKEPSPSKGSGLSCQNRRVSSLEALFEVEPEDYHGCFLSSGKPV